MVDTPGSNVVRLDWHRARSQPRDDDATLTIASGAGAGDDDPTIAVHRDSALDAAITRAYASAHASATTDPVASADEDEDDPTISRPRPPIAPPPKPSSSSSWISYAGDDDPTVSRAPTQEEQQRLAAARAQRSDASASMSGQAAIEQAPVEPQPPRLLDRRYQLQSRIATGGMGEVWEATQVVLGRQVAIKFLSHEEGGPRFKREAQAIVAVNHGGVVDVLDFGETEDGVPYFVMELLRGQPLDQLIRRQGGPLPWATVRRIGLEITDALAHAHAVGVIHRDLKPSNVLLLDAPAIGDSSTKLIDFGIAKLLDDNQPKLTKTGYIQGTPAYMSPEQVLGEAVDGRADVYGLGCLLYYLLTARKPFAEAAGTEALYNQLYDMPPSFAQVVPGLPIPAALEAIVFRALAKDKLARFPTMTAMREALLAISPGASAGESALGPSFAKDSNLGDRSDVIAIADSIRAEALATTKPKPSSTGLVVALVGAVVLVLCALTALAWALFF